MRRPLRITQHSVQQYADEYFSGLAVKADLVGLERYEVMSLAGFLVSGV